MRPVEVLVTGGGTGGHVYPALALAEELVRRGTPMEAVLFVGSARGLEATAVPSAGFPLELLPGRGLERRFTLANFGALFGAFVAFLRSWRLLGRTRPRVVVGVGGYASLACVVAARLRRIPVVVHEQNAAPGLANRIAVRLGARAAVAMPGTPLDGAVVVGNPVRAAVFGLERRPDPARPLVLVFGGSLGAGRINEAVLGLAERWRNRRDIRIRHIAGRRNFEACQAALEVSRRTGDQLEYALVDYEDHMEDWYRQASLAVCRAGAVTVAELAGAGLPAILVPLPRAPADHQTRNALVLVESGAGVLLPDAECTSERLGAEIDALLSDADRVAGMAKAALGLARPDAAARLTDLVQETADGR